MLFRSMLANPNFVDKAPADKVNAEREKKQRYEEMLKKVVDRLAALENK